MSLRHQSRVIVFQTLYSLDIKELLSINLEDSKNELLSVLHLNDLEENNIDLDYAFTLIKNILDRRFTIDEIIQKAAPEWPLDKIHVVDRNIIRLGLTEMLFSDRNEVPIKVAINESIEIAKEYGNDTSGKFVNGVLGSIYKEIQYTEDIKKQDEMKQEISGSSFEVKNMTGVILYKTIDGQKYFGFIYDVFKHWGACKSETLKQEGEDAEENKKSNIIRVINKEFGEIKEDNILNIETIGYIDFVTNNKDKNARVKKVVDYFLVEVDDNVLPDNSQKEGIKKADWIRIDDKLKELRFYPDFMEILNKAQEKVSWKN